MKTLLLIQVAVTFLLGFYLIQLDSSDSGINLLGITGNDIIEIISDEETDQEGTMKFLNIMGLFLIGFSILELIFLSTTLFYPSLYYVRTNSRKPTSLS